MTRPLKVFSTYQTVDTPWGGANNFLRALAAELSTNHPVIFTDTPDADTDVIFMNEMGKGPKQGSTLYTFSDIARFKALSPRAKIIVRVVNLKSHAYPLPFWKYILSGHAYSDFKTLKLMKMADKVIFQSHYQHGFFQDKGFRGKNFVIIHNGAAREFFEQYAAPEFSEQTPVRFLSTLFSKRKDKRQDMIAALSEIPMTEVLFAGHWAENIDSKNVKLLGLLSHDQLREALKSVHYIIHPSQKDPCPNSLIEGLNMGVPALYNSGAGSGGELAENYGIPWDSENLSNMVEKARRAYPELRNRLSKDRAYFGIRRAADAYYQTFLSEVETKNER